ncbi:MAG: hypothetical protein AAGB22_16035, partial [Bacteroidota bacterium]
KVVTDKADLVSKTLEMSRNHECSTLDAITQQDMNAIDESFEMSKYVVGQLKQVHPSIHYDLEKYYPEAWNTFHKMHGKYILDITTANMEKGIREGLYREDLNIPVVSKIYIARYDIVFDSNWFPPETHNFADVYLESFRYHIRGIASEAGIRYLMEKVQREKNNTTI